MANVLISRTFLKQYRTLPTEEQIRIKESLNHLGTDPFTPRPGADIKALKGTHPQKYRIRVGPYRIVYTVSDTIQVIEIFRRGREYRSHQS